MGLNSEDREEIYGSYRSKEKKTTVSEKNKPVYSGSYGPLMTMKCGLKVHRSDYLSHMRICFESKLGCFH